MDWGKKWHMDCNAGKRNLWCRKSCGATDVKINGPYFDQNHLLRYCLNWIGALTLSLLLKLSRSMKILSSKVALYLYKFTILAVAPIFY